MLRLSFAVLELLYCTSKNVFKKMVSALKSNNQMMREVLEVFQRGILENNRQPLKDIMEIISLNIQSE